MEAAQCSAKKSQPNEVKFLDNQSGNFLIVFGIIILIGGAIGYFMTLSSKVDTEVRSLGATQRTVYMKSDIRETVRQTMMGTNADCPASNPIAVALKNAFVDFTTSVENAKFSVKETFTPGTPDVIGNYPNAKCLFHPARYLGIEFRTISFDFLRASEPNFITLSSFVTLNVNIGFVSNGKSSALKYALRYRVDVLTMNHFGLISTSTGKLINVQDEAKVKVDAWVLADQVTRTQPMSLENFMSFPDTTKIHYNKKFWVAAPSLAMTNNTFDFMREKKLDDVFSYGIDYNVLPDEGTFKAPYQMLPAQWDDIFNYDIMDKIYVLPKLASGISAISSPTMGVIYEYGKTQEGTSFTPENEHRFTEKIYQGLFGNKNLLYKSCEESTVVGQFNLLIFNNLNQDFVIDFSGNTDPATAPPVFCGLIAAKSLTIILNDQTDDDKKFNHFIGKIVVKEPIQVQKRGELHIHDIMTVTNDKISYGIADLSNVKVQYYNQKYFSSQNFQLPFFKNQSIYSSHGGSTTEKIAHYLPRATKVFFDKPCTGSYICRKDEIDVPIKEELINSWKNDLLYEVFSVE